MKFDLVEIVYFFSNNWSKPLNGGSDYNYVRLIILAVTILLAFLCCLFFYKYHTNKNVKNTATKKNFYRIFGWGTFFCFIFTEIIIEKNSTYSLLPKFEALLGKNFDYIKFSLVNLIYFTVFIGIISYFMKSQSKNAKGIWFF